MLSRFVLTLLAGLSLLECSRATAQVIFTEIMYHPVEEPAFNTDGSPVLDLYEEVHEFLELYNSSTSNVNASGWRLSGGIQYAFPTNTVFRPGEYVVVAKDPERLKAVSIYNLAGVTVLGPFDGQLSNKGDSVHLLDATGLTIESVKYSAEFPWAISADGLGADEEWTGIKAADYQYRGRSLERVSFSQPANDPANWVASPMPGNPSPGRPNAVALTVPKPVVIDLAISQDSDGLNLIRNQQPVRIRCRFSSTASLTNVRAEWFVDDIEVTNEPVQSMLMQLDGSADPARFTAVFPGYPNRSLIRYRIRGDRGSGDEVISPRPDDPFKWHAYFVTPVRTSTKPIYDCLISSNSLRTLNSNITQNPHRVTNPDPPGNPRPSWNATEPAVVISDGVVYDIRMRYHGSRYNRSAGRNSFKWQFPRYRKFNGVTGIFETDKGNDFIVGHGLFRAAGLPVSAVRYVDLYLNNRSVLQRLEQGEFDGDMLDEYHLNQQALNPGSSLEPSGEIYKNVGTIDVNGEGPYGRGDGRKLSKPPYWTDLQMYDWTFTLQNHGWRGSYYWKQMIDAFWSARGDTPNQPNPNIPALRVFFTNAFDVDEMLTYIALENWCCPWDDTTQNHFFWQRRNGKWGMLPWDNDSWYGGGENAPPTASLFMGEVDDPNNNYRGPNFFKDGFIKAFRQELKERFFLLSNTFLHPDNLTALGFGSIRNFAVQRFASVNQQCGFGVFERPNQPSHLSPDGGGTALPPQMLSASAYTYSANPARPQAHTIWEIRSSSGTYLAPLWRLDSTTNLTSVAIPFEALQFGEHYFWRCTYVDIDGHPSLASTEASFAFGPSTASKVLVGISDSDEWYYDQSGTNLTGTHWTEAGFDDSNWPSGPALLAKEEAALPNPIRTPLVLGKNTYYFRKRFTFPGSVEGASIRLSYVIDDGCIIYINGKECLRVRMPDGPVSYTTFASVAVGDAVAEGPVNIPSSFFTDGENVIAAEVHQSSAASSDIVFGLELEATLMSSAGQVVLNEIAAQNEGSPTGDGTANSDWIELYNTSNQSTDLGGYSLSDDVLRPARYVFPTGTQIAAHGYLVIWCDKNTNALGLHTGFGLDAQGQTVALFAPGNSDVAVSDFVTYGLQASNFTLGRSPDGTGTWQLSVPTPGAINRTQGLASASGLKINEWMAAPKSGNDWFEVYNPADLPVALGGLYLTDDLNKPTNTRVPDFSFVNAHDYVKFIADSDRNQGANHVGFKLSENGEIIALFGTNGTGVIDSVSFGSQTIDVSQGRLPDGGDTLMFFPGAASPGAPNHLQSNLAPWKLSIARSALGSIVLRAAGAGTGSAVLEESTDLIHWVELMIASASDGDLIYTPVEQEGDSVRYFRVVTQN